jgi:hypothetical protein
VWGRGYVLRDPNGMEEQPTREPRTPAGAAA